MTPILRQAVLTKEAATVENVRKWATIADGAADTNSITDITAMVTDIEKKLTMMSVASMEPRPLPQQRSQSPAPRVHFDDEDYPRRSPTPDPSHS